MRIFASYRQTETTKLDVKAFISETNRLRPQLLQTARRILGDEQEAEDVVQDALLRLWQLQDEPIRNFSGMAQVVVRNLSTDIVRRRRPTLSLATHDVPDIADRERDEQIERILRLMDTLPTMQQTILRMRHFDGMEMRDIAQLIGTTEQAVRQSLSRARRSLLNQYNKQKE